MKRHKLQNDESMWRGATPTIFANAKKLRENMTNAESILWEKLRDNQFHGLKFRRQHPINKYIADFYCHKLKLIIEIDGKYHENPAQKAYDNERSEIFEYNDVEVIRFTNKDIENNLEGVLSKLKEYCLNEL